MSAGAHRFGPLDVEPRNIRPPFDQWRPRIDDPNQDRWRATRHVDEVAAIRDALAGVELGAYDRGMIEWLAEFGDDSTIGTVVSWLYRARQAGRDER